MDNLGNTVDKETKEVEEKLSDKDKNQQYVIYVNKKVLSKAKGQQKRNEKALKNKGFRCIIKGKENLAEFDIEVEVL